MPLAFSIQRIPADHAPIAVEQDQPEIDGVEDAGDDFPVRGVHREGTEPPAVRSMNSPQQQAKGG